MVKPYQILMVIDESAGGQHYASQLQRDEIFTYTVLTQQQDKQIPIACQSQAIDGIFLECSPCNLGPLNLLEQLKRQMGENCPPIVVIGGGDAEDAVRALKNGATDYLVGERITPDILRFTMQSAIEKAQLHRELHHSQEQCQASVKPMLDCGTFSSSRHRSEHIATLQHPQHCLQQVIDAAPIGIAIGAANGKVSVINDTMLALHGYTREEFAQQGMNWREFTPPEFADRIEPAMALLRNQGFLPPEEKELQRRDGSRIPIWSSAAQWMGGTDEHVAFTVDLTQQKQLAAALQTSQQNYQVLAEAMPQMVWAADATGVIHYWNQRWSEYSGLSEAESMGLAWVSTVHPEERDRTLVLWEQSLQQGQPFEMEYRVRRRDGVYHWFISRGIPTQDEQGKILGWMGTLTDIDSQKRLEERLQLVMRAVNGLIFDSDLQTQKVYRSEQLTELIGVPPETAVPTVEWWQNRIHPDDRAKLEPKLPELYASSQELYEGEYRVWHEEGRWIDVWERGCIVRNDQGQVVRVVGSTVDISDRKHSDATLQERSQHIQLLYETTRDLLSSTQPLTLVETVFNRLKDLIGLDVYINYVLDEQQQKLHLTFYGGFSPEVAQQIEWLDVGHAICGTAAQQRCQIVQDDVQILTNPKAKVARSLQVTAYASQPLVAQGKLFGTLSFGSRSRTHFTPSEQSLFQAICDQIAIALERSELLISLQQQTEELTRVNRIKDEFLAVLSHELRSPLNPILGWTKLLQSHTFDAARTAEALAIIERNAKLQTQLIDDLLDIAKILRGKLTLDMTSVDLAFIIEAAIDTVKAAALAKNIHLTPMLPAIGQVSGDAVRLQQVVWNLLSNAIKFTPNYGRIEVRLERIEIPLKPNASTAPSHPIPLPPGCSAPRLPHAPAYSAQITVTDTGKGINPQFLPHIFESFRQEDASTTRKFGGLGLGLAIARQLVEAHGGTITADSPGEGLGSTFTVCLPLATLEPELQQPKPVRDQNIDLTGTKVLIVDDEPDARELLAVLLTQYGAEVMVATSALEVLAMLPTTQPHLLISDIGMPSVDGYSLMQQIRRLPPEKGGKVPAIALTAYAGEGDQQHAIAAGFQQHLAKPIDTDLLVRTIVDWV